MTGAEFLAKDLAMSVENAIVEQLGTARKITIANTETTVIANMATKEEISARVAQLKKVLLSCTFAFGNLRLDNAARSLSLNTCTHIQELSETDSIYDTQKLSERIAKLAGGVAVIKVGASTESELEDKKLRMEDAKNATFAALAEGIVPGGGAALVHLSTRVAEVKDSLPTEDEKLGADIVQKGLLAPLRLIANNAGVEGDVILERVLDSEWEMGYDAMENK